MSNPMRRGGTHNHLWSAISDAQIGGAPNGYVFTVASGIQGWSPPPSGTVPAGGATGQVLAKQSATDYDIGWDNIEDLATAETDDTLVLAPDGAGGVEFRAETAAGSRHGVDAYKAAAQSISHNTGTALVFDTEVQDTDAYHDNSTNNTRFTVPGGLGGIYMVVAQGDWGSNSAGRRIHDLRTNGTTYINTNNTFVSNATNSAPAIIITALLPLAAGDYVEFIAYQDSGSSVNCTPKLRMYKISD